MIFNKNIKRFSFFFFKNTFQDKIVSWLPNGLLYADNYRGSKSKNNSENAWLLWTKMITIEIRDEGENDSKIIKIVIEYTKTSN